MFLIELSNSKNKEEEYMFTLFEVYSEQPVATFNSMDELKQFVGKCAISMNYGIYRSWSAGGRTYFDVGPRVYYVYNNN